MQNKPTAGILAIALGVLTALIPIVIFPVCTDQIELMNGKTFFMKCHWSAMAELLAGILMIFDGILIIGFKKHDTRLALSIMLLLFGLSVVLIPTVIIGMCQSAAMACRVGTEPALIVVGVITMAVAIINVIFQSNSLRKEAKFSNGKSTADDIYNIS